jgi:hypothetical protein
MRDIPPFEFLSLAPGEGTSNGPKWKVTWDRDRYRTAGLRRRVTCPRPEEGSVPFVDGTRRALRPASRELFFQDEMGATT